MKKNKIVIFLLLLLPLVFTIGFSSWIIIYSFQFSPSHVANPVSIYYDFSYTATYGDDLSTIIKPTSTIDEELVDIKYQYRLESESSFTPSTEDNALASLPNDLDAGSYIVKIIFANAQSPYLDGSCQVKLEIKPKKIRLGTTLLSINYGDIDPWWSSFKSHILKNVSFYDENNGLFTGFQTGDFYIENMHNGVYYYGDVAISGLKTTETIAGSTYIATVNLHEDLASNYEFIGGNVITIKFKTVLSNNKYYTIEDAILSGGDITLLGSDTKVDTTVSYSYIETCFSLVLETSEYFLNGQTLKVPYSSGSSDFAFTYNNSSTNVYSTLYIPDGIILNLSDSSNFIVGAIIDQCGLVEQRGVVINNGIINLDASHYKSYGFTKGDGIIIAKNSSEVIDVFRIHDWPSASNALSLANDNVFPVLKWTVHNTSCDVKIYKNSILNSVSFVVALSGITQIKIENLYIIGNTSSEKCLFKPTSSATSEDYILKSSNMISTSYIDSNQVYGQKDTIDVCGDYVDSNVNVDAGAYAFETNTDTAVPLSYFDINIIGGTLELKSSSYIVLNTTTSIYVAPKSELKITGNAYLCLLENSILTLNGTLSGTGTFGGLIKTTDTNAIIEIANFNVETALLKTGSETFEEKTASAMAIIKTGEEEDANTGEKIPLISSDYTTLTDIIYISKYYDSYYFEGSSEANTYTIKYVLNGAFSNGLPDNTVEEIEDSFPSLDDTYYIDYDALLSFNKSYYKICGWYTDSSLNDEYLFDNATITSTSSTLTLYAKWEEKTFTFGYIVEYENSETGELSLVGDYTIYNQNSGFTKSQIESSDISITTEIQYSDKIFNGYYLGNNDSYKINYTFTNDMFTSYVDTTGLDVIYLYCKFTDYDTYTIVYNSGRTDVTLSKIKETKYSYESFELPNTDAYDITDTSYQYYCSYWYFSITEVVINPNNISRLSYYISNGDIEVEDGNVITIVGYWEEKKTLTYYDRTGNTLLSSLTQYFKPGTPISILGKEDISSTESSYLDAYEETVITDQEYKSHSFTKWGLKNNVSITYEVESRPTFTEDTSLQALHETVSTLYVVSITTSNATITANGYTFTNNKIKVPSGNSVTFNITYSKDSNRDFLVDGVSKGEQSSYTLSITKYTTLEAKSSASCVAEGTLITLYDGSVKKIEDVTPDDKLLVFNHQTGKLDVASLDGMYHKELESQYHRILNLEFSNGEILRIVNTHMLFDCTLNKYVSIDELNINEFLYHKFLSISLVNDEFESQFVTIDKYYITEEYIKVFSPSTVLHVNCITNSILTVTPLLDLKDHFINIFDYNEYLMYDQDKMIEDINKYGYYEYEVLKDYISIEEYNNTPIKYVKLGVEKGLFTFDEVIKVLAYWKSEKEE